MLSVFHFLGGGFSSSCASLASLNARLFLPAFVIHRAAFPHPIPTPAAADSAAGRQGWRSQTGGGKMQKRTEESLLSSGRFKFFPAAGHARSQLFCPPIPPNQLSRRKQVLCFFPCTPRATALRQARVSGGNLQNCAPSAACGGAMTQERNVPLVSFIPLSFPIPKGAVKERKVLPQPP